MGSALAEGWLRTEPECPLVVYDKDRTRGEALLSRAGAGRRLTSGEPVGLELAQSLEQAAEARLLVVSVKPQDIEGLLGELADLLGPAQTVISTAAGSTLERLRAWLGDGPGLCRIMPNLAVAVGEGVIALAPEPGLGEERLQEVHSLLEVLGRVEILPEGLFNAVTALTASGPGFLALVLEGMEDGGVRAGLPRQVSRVFTQQMALGAARLLLEEGLSPAALKDRVASPGGTTIAGLAVLEDRAVRGALLRAVEAAAERGRNL
jgi:pyrroline-5-carboxylate reductase